MFISIIFIKFLFLNSKPSCIKTVNFLCSTCYYLRSSIVSEVTDRTFFYKFLSRLNLTHVRDLLFFFVKVYLSKLKSTEENS